jgi:hypothetical protein
MDKDKQLVNNSNNTSLFFRDNPNSLFVFKKTEKISAALYMLSNLLKDSEPLKNEWRSIGLELLSQALNLVNKKQISGTLLKALSTIEIAYLSDLISGMNYNIFKHELQTFLKLVEDANWLANSNGVILSGDFFDVGNTPINNSPIVSPLGVLKDMNNLSNRMSVKKENLPLRDNKAESSNRQSVIISLLKKGNELGIKDFVTAITGCSEKTVQRELSAMVSKGQIKKTGEKRWSRYSLI